MNLNDYIQAALKTPEPPTEYEQDEMEVRADAVRSGDMLVNHANRTVMRTKTGTKWTEIFGVGTDDRICRVHRDMTVTVLRKRESNESRKRTRRYDATQNIAKMLQRGPSERLADVVVDLESDVRHGYMVDYSRLGDLIEAQADMKIHRMMRSAMDCLLREGESSDIYDAYHAFVEEMKEQVLDARIGLSRSTNQLSNLMDEVFIARQIYFIRAARWLK